MDNLLKVPFRSVISSVSFRGLFPHIPRKISAPLVWYTEKIGLWSVLAALILINVYAKINLAPAYWEKLITTMQYPFKLETHVDLAQSLWKAGASRDAENELAYAQSLKSLDNTNSQVLGASTLDPEVLLNNWKNLPQNLTTQYNYWQNIVNAKPDFRDGYIQLTVLAYRLSKHDEAKIYLDKAEGLDPNSTNIKQLRDTILPER